MQVGLMSLRESCVELDVTCYLAVLTADEERQLRHALILAIMGLCRKDGAAAAPALANAA